MEELSECVSIVSRSHSLFCTHQFLALANEVSCSHALLLKIDEKTPLDYKKGQDHFKQS